MDNSCYICGDKRASKFTQKRKQMVFNDTAEANINFVLHYLCAGCKKLARKALKAEPPVYPPIWIDNLKRSRKDDNFRCQITNLILNTDDYSNAYYLSLDHDVETKKEPLEERGSLVVAHLINDMKSDLNLSEFRNVIQELSKIFNSIASNSDYKPEQDNDIRMESLINFSNWSRSNKPNPNKRTAAKTRKEKLDQLILNNKKTD